MRLSKGTKKELRKHLALLIQITIKICIVGLYLLFMKIPFIKDYPTISKIMAGIIISHIYFWTHVRVKAYFQCRREIEQGFL